MSSRRPESAPAILRALLSLAVVSIAASVGLAQPPDDSAAQLAAIEAKIATADTLAARRRLVREYLDLAAAHPPEYELNPTDRDRLTRQTKTAAEKQVELVPIIGRYNLLLCPPKIATVARQRGYVNLLDVSYILLRHLFGFDPVPARGYRIFHRYDFAEPRGAHSNWSRLDCWYGTKEWDEWAGPPGEWPGNPIHEMTHCFAGNSPARFAIESLPGSGEGWPKWTPLYIYQHIPDDEVLKRAATKHRREYVDALKQNFKKTGGDFWSIAPYDPAGGLLILLADATADDQAPDPFAPLAKTLSDLNHHPDPLIGAHAPLELLRFIATLQPHASPAFWGVLRQYASNLKHDDADAYRRWAEKIAPRIAGLTAASVESASAAAAEVDQLLAQIKELDPRSPYVDALREQALAALAQRLSKLGANDQAARVAAERRRPLQWSLLGPFRAASADAGMQTAFINETAASPAAAIAGQKVPGPWQEEPTGSFTDVHHLGPLFGQHAGDVAYAWTTIHATARTRLWAFTSGDDQCRAWLSGQPVGEILKHGDIHTSTRDFLLLDVKPGENTLLIKIANSGGPWGFYCRLTPALSPKP